MASDTALPFDDKHRANCLLNLNDEDGDLTSLATPMMQALAPLSNIEVCARSGTLVESPLDRAAAAEVDGRSTANHERGNGCNAEQRETRTKTRTVSPANNTHGMCQLP